LNADRCAGDPDLRQTGAQRRLAGNERRSSGRTALVGVVVGEHHAFAGDAVDVGRPIAHQPEGIGADVGLADVVAEYDEDVRPAAGWACDRGGRGWCGFLRLGKRIGCDSRCDERRSAQKDAAAIGI